MRLFIGIGLPPGLAERLARAARSLISGHQSSCVRWTPHENLHVTVSFLGQVSPDRVAGIEEALQGILTSLLHLELDGPGAFPNAGILYAQVRPSTALFGLAEEVFHAMETCGFPREQRLYAPHITLARFRVSGKERIHLRAHSDPVFQQSFEARELRLYESRTLPEGAQYEVLRAFPFAARTV